MTAAAAGAAGVLAMVLWDDITDQGPKTLVGGALSFDAFAQFVTITICAAVVLVALTSDDYLRREAFDGPEIYALFLVAATGAVVMASANDLIVLFIGLETMSLGFYVLAASYRRKEGSAEAGMKYFVLGGFSSAFLLYGIALVYGATGSTNLTKMVDAVTNRVPVERNDALVLAGVALLLVGLGFKVAAVPFHVWTPDVYQGAPTPVTAFMASVGKVGAFGALLRVFVVGLPAFRDDWRPAIWILAVLSLVVGSFLAVVQTDVKRMLAYSSISHAGFILVGVEAAAHRAGEADSGLGVPSALVYLLAYAVMVAGTFGVVALDRPPGRSAHRPRLVPRPRPDPPDAGPRPHRLPRRPGRRAVHVRLHRQVRRHPRRRRRAQLRAGDHRHGHVGRRRLPLPADHGQRLDGRPAASDADAGARSRSRPAWRSSPPPPSRCSSASSPAGCSTPPSTPPSSPASSPSRHPSVDGHRSVGGRETRPPTLGCPRPSGCRPLGSRRCRLP